MAYSKGIFFRLTDNTLSSWQQELEFVTSFHGLEHVELWIENTNLTPKHFNWLNSHLKPYTKIIHAPFIGIQPASFNPPLRQAATQVLNTTITIGQKIGAQLITAHLGSFLYYDPPQSAISRIESSFLKLLSHTQTPLLTIENMPRKDSWQKSAFSLTDLEAFWPNFTATNFTLDIGHCIKSGEDYLRAIADHCAHIRNIHLHDGTKDQDHQALGTGILQLNSLLKLLDQLNYTGFLTLETIGHENTYSSWQTLRQLTQ